MKTAWMTRLPRPGDLVNVTIVAVVAAVMFVPFLLILSGSLTSEKEILANGFALVPGEWSLSAFEYLFKNSARFLSAYKVSIIVTAGGTALGLSVTAMLAYPLSRRDLKGRRAISFIVILTMLLHGGMVSWYIVMTRYLGLRDSIWALIIPYAVLPFYTFLLKGFFQTLPDDFRESAVIDGAGEMTVFLRIILPLSLPGMATVGLFLALLYWNDWWLSLMLIESSSLYPVQYLLRIIVSNIQFMQSGGADQMEPGSVGILPAEGVKMATCLVTIGPVVLFYPFAQRYFIKGITLGGIKG